MTENSYVNHSYWDLLEPHLQAMVLGYADRRLTWDDYSLKRDIPQGLMSPEENAAWLQHIENDENGDEEDDGSKVKMIYNYVFERPGPELLGPVTVKFDERVWQFYYNDGVQQGHQGPNLEPLCAAFNHNYVWTGITKIQMFSTVEDHRYRFRFIRTKEDGQREAILPPNEFNQVHLSDHDSFVECMVEVLHMRHRVRTYGGPEPARNAATSDAWASDAQRCLPAQWLARMVGGSRAGPYVTGILEGQWLSRQTTICKFFW